MIFNNILKLKSQEIPFGLKRKTSDNTSIECYFGHTFVRHSIHNGGHHLSNEDLEPYRQIGDVQLDRIIDLLQTEGTPLGPSDDFLVLARTSIQQTKQNPKSCSSSQKEISEFIQQYHKLPPWVDMKQLKRGQDVFLSYAPVMGITLYYRSLVAGFAIPKIAAVIRSTGYLAPPSKPDQVVKRLADTGQLLGACMAFGIEGLFPDGQGWKTALRVRALHAKVRRAILSKQGRRSWDVKHFGIPINQEDMAGTLLAFCTNPIIGVEFIAGISMSKQEMLDYLALWRYIGWLLGVETDTNNEETSDGRQHTCFHKPNALDPCGPGRGPNKDSVRHSESLLESIITHILIPDETSIEVAHHLLLAKGNQKKQNKDDKQKSKGINDFAFYIQSSICRLFIGNPLADALCLPQHPLRAHRIIVKITSVLVLLVLRVYTLAVMKIPFFKNYMIKLNKSLLQRQHEEWQKNHTPKLMKLKSKTGLDSPPTAKSFSTRYKQSSCPFAMTMFPADDE